MIYNGVKSVEACIHALISVHLLDIYDAQKQYMIDYYGIDIFNEAEEKFSNLSHTFKLATE